MQRQKPPSEKRRDDRRAEDDPERGASDQSGHPRKLRAKLFDLRSYDRDVAGQLVVGIEQREVICLWHPSSMPEDG